MFLGEDSPTILEVDATWLEEFRAICLKLISEPESKGSVQILQICLGRLQYNIFNANEFLSLSRL